MSSWQLRLTITSPFLTTFDFPNVKDINTVYNLKWRNGKRWSYDLIAKSKKVIFFSTGWSAMWACQISPLLLLSKLALPWYFNVAHYQIQPNRFWWLSELLDSVIKTLALFAAYNLFLLKWLSLKNPRTWTTPVMWLMNSRTSICNYIIS